MKRFFVATLLLITTLPAFSQVKQLYGETRLGYEAAINGGQYAGNVRADYLNLILDGNIGPNISFFWRQRFTKPLYNPNIPLNATDHLWIRWDINDHWAIQGGKVPIMVGSFEFDAAPINLYYWGMFADRMPDVYAIGGNVICKIAPEQTLFLQFTQSPLGFGYNDLFHAGLIWYGRITPWWNTIWSANWMDDMDVRVASGRHASSDRRIGPRDVQRRVARARGRARLRDDRHLAPDERELERCRDGNVERKC